MRHPAGAQRPAARPERAIGERSLPASEAGAPALLARCEYRVPAPYRVYENVPPLYKSVSVFPVTEPVKAPPGAVVTMKLICPFAIA